ncbi:MAG TPA: S41 family peptidase [Gemmatimonadaceae bacterium]|nr:S41 family peptidase [Gemmatimonadaceae bacterium]
MAPVPLLTLAVLLGMQTADSTLSCATNLALLERKMHLDYAGYTLELRGDRLTRFSAMKRAMQDRADRATGDACYFVLRDFVDWFDDPHLFVYQSTRLDTTETARRAASVERRGVTEATAREYYRRRGAQLDPLEGIWYDRGMRVAIVPDSALGEGRFVAVMLASDTSTWSPGAVRARFARRPTGGYDVQASEPNYARGFRKAEIYRHVLLRMSPGMWGKEYPVPPADSGTLDPVDPHRPVVYRKNGTLVFAIPSHNGFKPALDSLVVQYRAEMSKADKLIIDLRGNEGGGSGMTNDLEPFVSLKEELPNPFPITHPLMLSSDDQIAYARRAFGSDTSAFVRGLLERLRAHPGELVPVNDPADTVKKADPRDWVVASGPRRVGVLIDRGTVSASEVFVLYALRSPRATVYGEPTAGALDYQSASIVPISPNEKRWYLGYGTITRGAGLPVGGMRGKGIPPQVRIDLRRVADPVRNVEQLLSGAAPAGMPRSR